MYNETFKKNDYLWFVHIIVNFAEIEREREREI